MKYIMLSVKAPVPFKIPIIFPNTLVHADVAMCIMNMLKHKYNYGKPEVVSAGECVVTADSCSGKSSTLSVESAGTDDAEVINAYDYLHGIECVSELMEDEE